MRKRKCMPILLIAIFLTGCAWIPARKEVRVDLTAPVGKFEGSQFVGIRYPFKISAPTKWRITTEVPPFMQEMGFDIDGLRESEVFVFNPSTQSNLQIDFVAADRYSRFNQNVMGWLVGTVATSSFKEEFEKDYGDTAKFELGPTTPYSLKGVRYAAKKYATYAIKGVKREHGWIYGFSEPYQIFIIYIAFDKKEEAGDRQAIKEILDSFEMLPKG